MDESTHGKSSLRSVKKSKDFKHSTSRTLESNPRIEKRRRIHLEHRNRQLIQLWRIMIFISITYGLGILIINNGWGAINADRIQIKGSTKINASKVIVASKIKFPLPLFAINPKQLEINLLKNLPIKRVQIRRHIIPPGLEIELKAKKAIVFADRRGPNGKELGMLDQQGYWIPITMLDLIKQPKKDVYVEGWMATHSNWIHIIIKNKNKLGSPLEKIIISPDGELSIKTEDFDLIRLGLNSFNFKEQMRALNQLSNNLPSTFVNQADTILDIKDPSKPEIQIPKVTK